MLSPAHAEGFVAFGEAHVTALGLAVLLPVICSVLIRRSGREQLFRPVRQGLAALLVGTWILWIWFIFHMGWQSAQTILPMHLCDWAAIACILTLLAPRQQTYELAYFWGLSGTLPASLTPELTTAFPDLRFDIFFLFHGGVIASVLLFTFGLRMRPRPASIPRVMAWSLIYLGTATLVDWKFGTNFGYLRHKPITASPLDLLAPWPWYIGELAVIAIILFLIAYLPFWIIDRFSGQTGSTSGQKRSRASP